MIFFQFKITLNVPNFPQRKKRGTYQDANCVAMDLSLRKLTGINLNKLNN